ncbi:MAG: UbiX family flavin prenyltransferase [Deltaproteobacteria bacterium]|nr:MAG: UbiX family flavin prenyltransferase [Deltaproteobacteria bacterium]
MKRVVVAVSGASGAPYARRLLDFCAGPGRGAVQPHLLFTRIGRMCWADEVGTDPAAYGFPVTSNQDLAAAFASGSARFDGMVIIPCSAGQLGRIAHGISADLVGRAADVMLKERRPLVLVLRESPYSLVHVRNMAAVIEAGATVLPASPSFYSRPADLDSLLDTVVSRVLDHLGVDNDLVERWTGRPGAVSPRGRAPTEPDPDGP